MVSVFLAASLLLSINGSAVVNSTKSIGFSNSFSDCGVYTIHSAYNQNLVLSSSGGLSLKAYTNDDSQRFVIRKELGQSNFKRYRISPLKAQNLSIGLSNNPFVSGAKVELIDENDMSSPNYYWFSISQDTDDTSFKLTTSASSYSKYLTAANYDFQVNNELIQSDINLMNESIFEWKFIKTNDLVQNSMTTLNLSGTDFMRRLIVSQTSDYIIKIEKKEDITDLVLEIANSSGDIIATNENRGYDSLDLIEVSLCPNTDYYVNARSKNNVGKVILSLFPKKQVYFTSFMNAGDIDTRPDMIEPYNLFKRKGYVFNHINNPTYYDFYLPMTDGKLMTQHEYFMISSHGGDDGGVSINPSDSIACDKLPSMEGCYFSIWATCYGGSDYSPAVFSILNGGTYSLGWNTTIGVDSSRIFTNYIWNKVLNGTSVESAIQQTVDFTYNLYKKNNILHPILYSEDEIIEFSPTSKTIKSHTATTTIARKAEFDYSLYDDCYPIKEEGANAWLQRNDYEKNSNFNGVVVYRLKVNSYLTNEYIINDLSNETWLHSRHSIDYCKAEKLLTSYSSSSEKAYLYEMDDGLDLIEENEVEKSNGKYNESYRSLITNREYTEGDMFNAYF